MGQKVDPKGLRIGIVYNWNSRWYFSNKKLFKDTLISDIKIRRKLLNKFAFASVTQIDIERAIKKITAIIYSVKPGMIIGRGGKGLEDVKKYIVNEIGNKKDKELKIELKIEPVKKPYLSAYFVSQLVAEKLIKGFSHRSVIHQAMNRVIEAGAKGVKIQIGGRINGAEISRREKYFQGTIPTSTIRELVDFSRYPALTKSGYVGVKVWICR
ncbi:30S ribosomal protein S3 [Candidatus Roizmanbacteria bacterium RIFOXYB2_FULL_38_10]|uniref:Small ribosomal subunit protein uS3 n=1 Tax=Candidatus Roizmanbacteria bacterium RIFOXYD1_FULL_38_12 TaxID=1802093 RepID=A0A1F7KZS9_9BACT|nr:MAG: 30S ribosomal protein S3 [Candidatus Roizmanbacteria bacterium RIFOXYA2_FULL_38_14]OGK63390.1 MAG: 30S ribosomal protein S3 [Candidatus Roizmanbacteria bacterium RIFOXYA1_FULL_37_12]OGK65236.1 MAG: 30S ribosomal protein S3 [Candidatus Roizmanbacteria bacterium RIFOXYB1_FULL_40_23]OGK68789.1 MAG: 30S ribosomal protein S3 [Candidatus Roizmanbacteria bacterium RIFOXYB2_FULL_38_10]OGK69641.1 MAG: 30S ribosomal protein S3 [Candidatus Roizmanbacteria bacterium RIFOXYC1_FULL_38_14]OGK72791.1 